MAYSAHNWVTGDTITADQLNALEAGTAAAALTADSASAIAAAAAALPAQAGNGGKYLTTDGTSPSWATVAGGGGLSLTAAQQRSWVSVVDYGADPTGASDDTTAFANAFAASALVFVPPGTYNYNGTGIDRQVAILTAAPGADASTTRIMLGATSYMFHCTQVQTKLYISGILFVGGKGAYKSTFTGANVFDAEHVITDCHFKNFTECAIGTNASDWPNWKIQRNFFTPNGAAACIALSGKSTNDKISDCGFGGTYRIGVKLGQSGNHAKLENLDFTAGTAGTSGQPPHVEVWIVPQATNSNIGAGFVLSNTKFGNEHLNPGVDFRVAYADEDTSNGSLDFCTRPPLLTTASTGWVGGHVYANNAVVGAGTPGNGNPFVYSTTPNVAGCRFENIVVGGSGPSYILQFADAIMPLAPSRQNSTNIIGPVLFGSEDTTIGFSYCNAPAAAKIIDPVGAYQNTADQPLPTAGGGLGGTRTVILSDAQASTFTGTATLAGVTDSLGGTDAVKVTYGGTSQYVQPAAISSGLLTSMPVWVEFDLLNDGTSPMSDLALYMNEAGTQQHRFNVSVAPASAGWLRYRYQTALRSTAANLTVSFQPGMTGTLGSVNVGRLRVYQAREATAIDLAHRGHYAGFYGATPVAKPTVSGTILDGTATTNLLTALASQGLIASTATLGSAPSALPSQTGNSGKYLTTDGTTASWGAAAGGGVATLSAILGTDVALTTTTLGNVSGLSVSVIPGTYALSAMIDYDGADVTADLSLSWSGPTGTTGSWSAGGASGSATTQNSSENFIRQPIGTSISIGTYTSRLVAFPVGTVIVTNSGTFQLQASQSAAGGTVNIRANSYIRLDKLA